MMMKNTNMLKKNLLFRDVEQKRALCNSAQ